MNTPAHLVVGMAAFGRPGDARVTAAALAGGLLPDLSLYLMAGWELYLMRTPPEVVFGRMYFSDAWQSVFAVDNSAPLWGVVLALGLWSRRPWVVALAGAALLHLAFDFALHAEDARPTFWPITDWKFVSPLSYWDPARYGDIIGPIEVTATLALGAWLWLRHRSVWARMAIVVLMVAEAAPFLVGGMVFEH